MQSLEEFKKSYETDVTEIVIRGRRFRFFVPKRLERFLDPEDLFHDFPLWAKVWESSLVLADHLTGMAADPEKRLLEIGCGLGVAGIAASSFGHRVLMTEYNPDALKFARANADLNNCPRVEIEMLDWNAPSLNRKFDFILGSEVVYKEEDFDKLLRLFRALLKPDGEIILAEGFRKTSMEFFGKMQEFFEITARRKVFRSGSEEFWTVLGTMKWKQPFAPEREDHAGNAGGQGTEDS